MHSSKRFIRCFLVGLLTGIFPAHADWREDVGWDLLQIYAGSSIPTGSGLNLEMTEAFQSGTVYYMPNTTISAFSGINFTNISGSSTTSTSHATTVGLNYFASTSSLLTGADSVGVYSANDFLNNFLGTSTSGQVGTSTAAVMSHAYIGAANPSAEAAQNEIIKRFDFFCQDSGVLNVVGMNNGSSGTIPPILGSSHNAISVGRSDGLHSHGSTPANYPGPGRQKPEIVSTSTSIATSYATGAVSSAASLLYAKAELAGNANATHPDTIKACLMAGATKAEFPNWSQTSSLPLDTTYGAGELNIFHSYRIIENAESLPGNVAFRGWDRDSVTSSTTKTYTFTTPDYVAPLSLSAALLWQRSVTETVERGGPNKTYSYAYQDLANLRLELLDQSGALVQNSDSGLNNVEHIWNTQLSPNTTYSLRVSSSSGDADYSLAWRVNGKARAEVTATPSGSNIDVGMNQLINNVSYTIRRSTDLSTWADVNTFTATGTTETWTDSSVPAGTRVFYRLFFIEP